MKLFKLIKMAVAVAAPVVTAVIEPKVLLNVALGAVIKHGVPGVRINQAIPYINMAVTGCFSYAQEVSKTHDPIGAILPSLQRAGVLTAVSTGIHQLVKIPLKGTITGVLAQKVGPGAKFSI